MNMNLFPLGHQNFERFVENPQVTRDDFKIAVVAAGQGGTKIAAEFVRLGVPGLFINTCNEDTKYTTDKLDALKNEKLTYDTLHLEGYSGAHKNREIGKEAIVKNQKAVVEKLRSFKAVTEADYVFVIATLGGGTGNGIMSSLIQLVSILRKDKTYSNGRPTVGLIAAVPDKSMLHKIQLNSHIAIQEVTVLQERKQLGACLLVDNEKLMTDYLNGDGRYKEWFIEGNMIIPRLIIELFSASYLTGPEIVDHSEIYDVFVTGGYLNISKKILKISESLTGNKDYKKMMEDAFQNSDILAEGYNPIMMTHGGVIIVKRENSKIMTSKDEKYLERAAREYMAKAKVRTNHFGVHYNNLFGTIKEPEDNENIIIYTFCIYAEAPKRILESTKKAVEDEKERKKLQSQRSEILDLDISGLLDEGNNVNTNLNIDDFNLADVDLLGNESNGKDDNESDKVIDLKIEDLDNVIKRA